MSNTSKKATEISSEPMQTAPTSYPYITMNTWLTFNPHEDLNFEPVDSVSVTVPDMVVPLELLINRAQSGIPIPMRQDGYNEEDYPDFFKMDEFELAQYREDLAHQMQDILQQHHDASKILEEKENEARKIVVTKDDEKEEKQQKEPKGSA